MSLKIDGIDVRDLELIFLKDHDNPAAPPTRDYSLTIPGMHGAYDYGSDLGTRQIKLPLGIREQATQNDLALLIRNLVPIFIDSYGKPKTIKLIFDYEPDVFYFARYSGSLPIDRLFRAGKFTLPMTAFNPFKHFIVPSDEIMMDSDVSVLSDITLDAIYSFNITSDSPPPLTVYNDGNLVVRPKIIIDGTASNIQLWNTENGKIFFINNVNRKIEISGEDYTVKVDGVNSLTIFNGDFLELLPGANNIVVDGKDMNLTLDFIFYHQYL